MSRTKVLIGLVGVLAVATMASAAEVSYYENLNKFAETGCFER